MKGTARSLALCVAFLALFAAAAGGQPAASAYYSLVQYPDDGFSGVYNQITHAAHTIDMEIYELADPIAERDLAAAAGRGVRVRVLLDRAFSGAEVNRDAAAYLAAHGVAVRWAPSGYIFHIKTTTFDATTSDVSTANLVAKYYPDTRDAEIVDTDPVQVRAIEATFANDWSAAPSGTPRSQTVQAPGLIWSPNTGSGSAEDALVTEIAAARKTIDFESEELSDTAIIGALAADARRGVTCRVVMTDSSEWHAAFAAITAAGCQVHLFPDRSTALYIHEKLILDDQGTAGESLLLGSQNASFTSLTRNRELGILLTRAHGGAVVIASAAAIFDSDFKTAVADALVANAAPAVASAPNPQKAAAALVTRLEASSKRAHVDTFAASKVVSRHGSSWFAYGSTPAGNPFLGGGAEPTSVRIYRWTADRWELSATVSGALAPSAWIYAESLTGSADPDFAIEGCGAGDTNCLSVVSDIGGRWHAVAFEYGYGLSLEVNGVPAGSVVNTEVDTCGCAGGPTTTTTESFHDGIFVPVFPAGKQLDCSPKALTAVADGWTIQVLEFERTACAGGWALAIGTGAGFSGPAVGLFERSPFGNRWRVVTLDDGTALAAAPAMYDIPLGLLVDLASGLGSQLTPEVAAARLIAALQTRFHFYWPPQNGVVIEGGAAWLIAPVPAGKPPNDYSPYPVAALIYRWSGSAWALDGRLAHLPSSMNISFDGGWFTPAPASTPSTVAFGVAGGQPATTNVITNAGGHWHVESGH